jgi:hypothetical protein
VWLGVAGKLDVCDVFFCIHAFKGKGKDKKKKVLFCIHAFQGKG